MQRRTPTLRGAIHSGPATTERGATTLSDAVLLGKGEMRPMLSLTGVTVNAMALIAPGAFLWTTFQEQAAQTRGGHSTAPSMWTGLLFGVVLAFLTAYSYSELARIYPGAGTGSSYYFAEAAFLDKERPRHRRYARGAKLAMGWISHLYYWIYPGIMIAFIGTVIGYIYSSVGHHKLSYLPLAVICGIFATGIGYVAYRGISGSTVAAIAVNVIQIVTLVAMGIFFIVFRMTHPHEGYALSGGGSIVIPRSFVDLLLQSTIAILLLVGFESVTALGAEARNPHRDIRRGVLLSLVIQGAFCYVFEYFSANLVIAKATETATRHLSGYSAAAANAAPIKNLVQNTVNRTFGGGGVQVSLFVAVTVLLALVGTTLACRNTGVRVTYAMAKDKEMPSLLGLLHGRFATPLGGIVVLATVSGLLGIYGVQPSQVDNLTQITLASNIGTFLVYGGTCLIAFIAFASRRDRQRIKHRFIPGLGVLMNLAELLAVAYLAVTAGGSSAVNAYKALAVVGGWVLLGLVWVVANPRRREAQAVLEDRLAISSVRESHEPAISS